MRHKTFIQCNRLKNDDKMMRWKNRLKCQKYDTGTCSEICNMKCRISIQKCHSSPIDCSSYKLDSLCLILLQFFCYRTQIIAMCTFLFIDCSYSLFRGLFHDAYHVQQSCRISSQINSTRAAACHWCPSMLHPWPLPTSE